MPLIASAYDGRVYDDAEPRFIDTGGVLAVDRLTGRYLLKGGLPAEEIGEASDAFMEANDYDFENPPPGPIGVYVDAYKGVVGIVGGVAADADEITVTLARSDAPETPQIISLPVAAGGAVTEIAAALAALVADPFVAVVRGAQVHISGTDGVRIVSLEAETANAGETPEPVLDPIAVAGTATPTVSVGGGVTSSSITFSEGGPNAPEANLSMGINIDGASPGTVPDVTLPAGSDAEDAAPLAAATFAAAGFANVAFSATGATLTATISAPAIEITLFVVNIDPIEEQ